MSKNYFKALIGYFHTLFGAKTFTFHSPETNIKRQYNETQNDIRLKRHHKTRHYNTKHK